MRCLPPFALFAVLCSAAGVPAAGAQEFRVHTTVSELPAGGKPVELARNLTLFHAGQAWDFAVEAAEVVRFDPAAGKFTLLDLSRDLTCDVTLAEIDRRRVVGRTTTEEYLAKLAGDPAAAALSRDLAFQLAPRFAVTEEAGVVAFKGGPIEYEVVTAAPKGVGTATFYLDYADWTARLNYALRPGRFPGVRTAVNEQLRARGVMPQTVTVTNTTGGGADGAGGATTVLRAEHVIQESLAPRDRELLAEWRGRLTGGTARAVSFREYVRQTTGAVAQR